MKKYLLAGFSFILVLTMLLSSTGTALAAPLSSGPSISASSGGGSASLTAIPVAKLPGTEKNASGTIFPQGHASGDKMFAGDGVEVSGLVGYATLSLPLKNYTYGWTGSIYQYLDGAWVILPTTITKKAESNDGTASATIYSNGIFSLQVGYAPAANSHLSLQTTGNCSMITEAIVGLVPEGGHFLLYGFGVAGTFPPTWVPAGTPISMRIINVSGGSFIGSLSWNNTVNIVEGGAVFHIFGGGESLPVITYEVMPESYDVVITLKGCSITYHYPEDLPPVY